MLFVIFCLGELRAVLQVVIEQVSRQKSTIEQLLTRIESLEDSNKNHQMLIDQMTYKYYGSNEVNRGNLRLLSKKLNGKLPSRNPVVKLVSKKRARPRAVKIKHKPRAVQIKPELNDEISEVSMKILSKQKSLPENGSINLAGAPIAKPIEIHDSVSYLSSSEINSDSLVSIDEVLWKYRRYIVTEKVSALARRLAIEAVFGNDILKKCTPKGRTKLPALPTDLLYTLKQTLLNACPSYWAKPVQFEDVWNKKCLSGLKALCNEARYPRSPISNLRSKSLLPPTARPVHSVGNALPSSEIDKSTLISLNEFMSRHSSVIRSGKYKIFHWCRFLAREVYFGPAVLKRCTPFGRSDHFGLPTLELNQLKQAVLSCCPSYWSDLDEFEKQWDLNASSILSKLCANYREK